MKRMLGALCAAALMSAAAFAHEFTAGDLTIDHPWARATAPKAPVGGGYMTIVNTGAEADRLISASADFAGKVEIHEMTMENDVMKMRPLPDGVAIPAGEAVELKPGGLHIMLMGLTAPLVEGETRPLTLVFEKAGDVTVELKVEGLGGAKPDSHDTGHGSGHGGTSH